MFVQSPEQQRNQPKTRQDDDLGRWVW